MYEYDAKLLKLIVDYTPKAIFGLVVGSFIFIWTYIEYVPLKYLLIWGLLQAVFMILRHINSKMLLKYIEEDNEIKLKFHTIFLSIIVVLSALIWISGTILGAVFAPTPYEFVAFALIMGIVSASLLSLTPVFNLFLAYFFIMILTQLGIMIYFGTHAHLSIVVFLLIYMPVILLLSKSISDNHYSAIDTQASLEAHNEELRELSITDSLTKVYNRRHFFEAAQTLVSISKREKNEISFLMIDIDNFKNVNDTYGHHIGDYILVRMSQEIKNMTRDSDIFARIGGEEFALLLHNTSIYGAKIIAEKIRSVVEKIDFNENYISVNVTISIGCASISESVTTLEELYQEADKKLYIAKELGRNRVQ